MSFQLVSGYISYITLFAGLIGNLFNLCIFTQLKIFRTHQAAFYLIVASTIDSLQLLSSTATRSTSIIFGVDPTRSTLIWCKLRGYIAAFSGGTSMYILCLAAIDQYLSTNSFVRLRLLSSYQSAQYSTMILVIISLLYNIPFLVFNEIQPITGCNTYDVKFNYFYSWVHFSFFAGLLPLSIATLFSLLAYQNVRRIVQRQIPLIRRRLDRQLTAMILVRVLLLVVTSFPFISIRIYQMNFPVNSSEIDQILRAFITMTYSLNYSLAFYVFLLSSNRFRRQVKCFLWKKTVRPCFNKFLRTNRIKPEHKLPNLPSSTSSFDCDG